MEKKTHGAGDKKRKSLSLHDALPSCGFIAALNTIQVIFIAEKMKKTVSAEYEANCQQITAAYAQSLENKLWGYSKELDVYVHSEIVRTGDINRIGEWLETQSGIRSSDFDYVMFCGPGGLAYTDIGKRTDIADRPYYAAVMVNGLESYIDNPVISKTTGDAVFHVTCAVKYDGKIIGFFAGVVNIDGVKNTVNRIRLGKTGNAWIIASDGTVIAHKYAPYVMNKNFITGSAKGHEDMTALAKKMVLGGSGSAWVNAENSGREFVTYKNIQGTPWSFAFSIADEQIYETVNNLRIMMIFLSVVLVIALLFLVNILTYTSVKPLRVVEKTITGIAAGNADLTQRITVRSNNEIGSVVSGFNKFTEKLQDIVTQLKKSETVLIQAGEELHQSTDDTAASITEILANIDSMGSRITNQAAGVEETAGAVHEIASNIASLEHMIESQAASVTQASAAVEQMIGNINAVNESVEKMAESFTALEQNAHDGAAKQDTVNERIVQIENESEMLQEANEAIAGIAEQTNLLAMNAAIEAAHAGEAGKGFSVVSDEIRKLSETSAVQSKTIGDQLNKIRESIQSVVDASAESSRTFNAVAAGIHNTDELVHHIKEAMTEQTEGSKQISVALHTMNDSTVEVKTASEEMSAGNNAILEEVKDLQNATMSMKDSMDEMKIGAGKINETGARLADIASKMNGTISDISGQVDQFKV